MSKGMLFVVSGPSASGKDTVIGEVMEKLGSITQLSVSMTTRSPRQGEEEGIHYFFVSEETFKENIINGKMLEYAQYGRYYYGTPIAPVEKWLEQGKIVFLIIEVQGGEKIRLLFPQAKKIFIMPPSFTVLEQRLRCRGTEAEDSIRRRLSIAHDEIKRAEEYDYVVVNDKLEDTVSDVLSIVRAQQLSIDNMKSKISEVNNDAES